MGAFNVMQPSGVGQATPAQPVMVVPIQGGVPGVIGMNPSVHVPLPRQMEYDGSSVSFVAFLESFNAGAEMAGWQDAQKLYRLRQSLRGEALEYFTTQLSEEDKPSFDAAVQVLQSRFEEKKAPATYRAQLRNRQMQPKESATEFLAALKKLAVRAYPETNNKTRDSIVLQHFLNGLQDHQAAMHIGMKQPATLEEAEAAYETYVSLSKEVP